MYILIKLFKSTSDVLLKCVFATSAVCCVLLTAMAQFEEILFVVKVRLSGPIVPGDSKEGE